MNSCKNTTTNQMPTVAATGTGTLPPTKPESTYEQNTASAVIPVDKTCYVSADGQFRIEQLVQKTVKYPPSPYPCIVLQFFPAAHTRIRRLEGGGLEAMLTTLEVEEFVEAFNNAASASGKGKIYDILQRVPEKSKEQKAKWRQWNEKRLGIRKPTRKSWPKRYQRNN